MAVATAAQLPRHCSAAVTISALAFTEQCSLDGIRQAGEAFRDPAQFERLSRYHGDKASWVLEAWTGTWLGPAFAAWSLDDMLTRVRCPLLAIHGDRDEYGTQRQPERMSAMAAGPSEVVLIEGCGHFPHRERPDHVLSAMERFLELDAAVEAGTDG